MDLLIVIPIINLSFIKLNRRGLKFFTLINYVLSFFLFFNNFSNIAFLIILLTITIYLYISTKNLIYSIMISMLSLIIIGLSDATIGMFFMNVLGISVQQAKLDMKLYFIIAILILFLTSIISKALFHIISKINNLNAEIKKYNYVHSFVILSIFVILLLFNIYMIMCKFLIDSWNHTLIILHLFLLLCFFIVALTLIYSNIRITKSIIQQESIDKEYTQLKEYTTIVESVSTDLRRFKHDYLNILTTLGDYIEEKDMDGLYNFYHSELLPKSNKLVTKDKHLDLLKYIKLTPLKSLVSSKIISAQALAIETKIEISENITKLSIDTLDICRIIGILFDNAIEGTLLCEEKLIHFAVIKVDTNTIFVINNTCVESLPPIYKLYEENFSTKGEGHGIGLKTVRDIINNDYNNVLINTKIEYGLFKQELIIKENDN